jgi:hypothetical protein
MEYWRDMFKRLLGSKFTVLFLSMALLGFLIGYDYAMVTSKQDNAQTINGSNSNDKMEPVQNTDSVEENIGTLEENMTIEEEATVEENSEIQEEADDEQLNEEQGNEEQLNQQEVDDNNDE